GVEGSNYGDDDGEYERQAPPDDLCHGAVDKVWIVFMVRIIRPILPGEDKRQQVDGDDDEEHDGLDDEEQRALFNADMASRKQHGDEILKVVDGERLHEQYEEEDHPCEEEHRADKFLLVFHIVSQSIEIMSERAVMTTSE